MCQTQSSACCSVERKCPKSCFTTFRLRSSTADGNGAIIHIRVYSITINIIDFHIACIRSLTLKHTFCVSDVIVFFPSIVVFLYLLFFFFFITVMLPCCDGEIKLYIIKQEYRLTDKTANMPSNFHSQQHFMGPA